MGLRRRERWSPVEWDRAIAEHPYVANVFASRWALHGVGELLLNLGLLVQARIAIELGLGSHALMSWV